MKKIQVALTFMSMVLISSVFTACPAPGGNTITWSSSMNDDDEYPEGTSSSPGNVDFTFRIYDSGAVDQQMETTETGYAVNQGVFNWQEFVPGS